MKQIMLLCWSVYSFSSLYATTEKTNPQQSVLLKMNLQKGAKYLFTTGTDQSISQEIMGNAMQIKQQTTVDYLYDVLENNAEGLHIKTTYQRFAIQMQSPQGNHSFDSDARNNEDGPLKNMGGIVGKSFDMYISPEGKVTKVEGMEQILNTIGGDESTQELLAQQFNDSAFMNMMNTSLHIYPNKEVKKGESWLKNAQASVAGIMEMNLQNTFTLTDFSDAQANLSVQSNIDLLPSSSGSPLGEVAINLKGTQNGNIVVESKSGLITSSKMHQEISGDIGVQGMKIPMTVVSEITLTGKML